MRCSAKRGPWQKVAGGELRQPASEQGRLRDSKDLKGSQRVGLRYVYSCFLISRTEIVCGALRFVDILGTCRPCRLNFDKGLYDSV